MKTARHAALEEAARKIKDSIPWSRYRSLAKVFQHRPYVNIYWLELVDLCHWYVAYASGADDILPEPVHEIMFAGENSGGYNWDQSSVPRSDRVVQLRDAASKALTWIQDMRPTETSAVVDELRDALERFG